MKDHALKENNSLVNLMAIMSPSAGMILGVLAHRFFAGQSMLGIALGATIGAIIGILAFLLVRRIFCGKAKS
ncbi:MAG: hypothetical protein J6U23_12345 [Clostridiales bacterium]|nr:hypothetical protein [Clostridiales bacterium]